MNSQGKPKEVPVKPANPEIRPDINVPTPKTEPEHPIRIVPVEEPEKNSPPEVEPEKEQEIG